MDLVSQQVNLSLPATYFPEKEGNQLPKVVVCGRKFCFLSHVRNLGALSKKHWSELLFRKLYMCKYSPDHEELTPKWWGWPLCCSRTCQTAGGKIFLVHPTNAVCSCCYIGGEVEVDPADPELCILIEEAGFFHVFIEAGLAWAGTQRLCLSFSGYDLWLQSNLWPFTRMLNWL